jgi:Holliday junction resolvase
VPGRLDRERRLKQALGESGWVAVRAAKGPVDLVLVRRPKTQGGCEVRFVQVKSTAGGPYERFGPKDRQILIALAQECGAEPWLIHWPPRKGWRWIESSQWPKIR